MRSENFQPATKFPQFYNTVIMGSSGLVVGTMIGWNSMAVRLTAPGDCNIPGQANWSWDGYYILGMVIGSMAHGQLARLFGYRLSAVLCDLLAFVGWLAMAVMEPQFNDLISSSGRVVQGLGTGGLVLLVPIYISHITEFDLRGRMQMTHQIFTLSGVVISYALGSVVPFISMTRVCCVLPILHAAMAYFFVTESAYYLYRASYDSCTIKKTMGFVKGHEYNVDLDYYRVKKYMNIFEYKSDKNNKRLSQMWTIGMGLMIFQQLCGGNALMFHMEEIINKLILTDQWDGTVQTLTLGIYLSQFLSSFITIELVDRVGRKCMLIASALGMGLSLSTLAVQHVLTRRDKVTENDGWYLSVMLILAYACSYSIGWGTVVMTVYTEIVHFNKWFSFVIHSIGLCLMFAIVNTFFDPEALTENTSRLWFYFASCVISVPFVYFCVPETRAMRLDHIQSVLVYGSDRAETTPILKSVTIGH